MPVAVEGLVGYASEKVPMNGGTRTYRWLIFLRWGIEVLTLEERPHDQGDKGSGTD